MTDWIPSPVRDDSKDGIQAGTLRLTLGTQAVAVIGAVITGLDPLLGDSFSAGQKTAIIVAAIAFIALAQVADVLSRAWVTAASSAPPVALEHPQHFRVTMDGPDYDGRGIAARSLGGDLHYQVVPDPANGHHTEWLPESRLTPIA